MSISKEVKKELNALIASGATLKKIRGYLAYNDVSEEDTKELIAGLGLGGRRTFVDSYYGFLATGHRNRSEAEDYINGLGEYGETSDNVKKHLSHYLKIWELSHNVWATKRLDEAA